MALRRSRTSGGALDFVSASLPCGRRVRILTMITLTMIDRIVADDFSREGLAAGVDPSLPGIRVGCERDRIAGRRGYTCRGVPDNGTELTLSAILKWQQDHNVEGHSIASGKSTQNRFVEAFNGQMADEETVKNLVHGHHDGAEVSLT